ncbi:hypothetical protein MKZ38_008354 [Zalerion maritima]|uniref:tRNA-intron lyase n=1 Tax=Zalerion maritima TaxID=339359 RepID=A0AAD5RUC0_9PEZI|nr:hypothetical protein MKZ38_008354 [Zalerion maritima]
MAEDRTSTPEATVAPIASLTATSHTPPSPAGNGKAPAPKKAGRPSQRRPPLNQIYALPSPVRTFPLPAFHPTNPLSLAVLVSTWVGQVVSPPVEPSVIHDGIWYPEIGGVHIVDPKSMRALWEQGFYGKGNLSRSEPHWLDRVKTKAGVTNRLSSENLTAQRREERQKTKWDRARAQQEAIEQTRREEAERLDTSMSDAELISEVEIVAEHGHASPRPPTGPMELLVLPNSVAEIAEDIQVPDVKANSQHPSSVSPTGPFELLSLPNSLESLVKETRALEPESDGHLPAPAYQFEKLQAAGEISHPTNRRLHIPKDPGGRNNHATPLNGSLPPNGVLKMPSTGPVSDSGASDDSKSLKRQKSVRFSPTVEAQTFKLSDPPNPNAVVPPIWSRAFSSTTEWIWGMLPTPPRISLPLSKPIRKPSSTMQIDNLEHLQLTPEEAFFLSFAFGALRILDPSSKDPIPLKKIFLLFRQYSYFPPRIAPNDPDLRPDDPFTLHYVVYHHFRSLGWCVRSGIKFGVDWLLYLRGPVFNHAEFGILVLPSYTEDQWWKEHPEEVPPQKSWNWLSGIGRTLSQVYKSLVLVYVDIPSPRVFEETLEEEGFAAAFGHFRVREIMFGRWLHNRNRSVANTRQMMATGKGQEAGTAIKTNRNVKGKGNGNEAK